MTLRPAACLFALGWFAVPAPAGDWLGAWDRPLATARGVRQSTPAAAGWPVKLTGVVTHVNPHLNDFWVQDETAGVHVRPAGQFKFELPRPGDRVEVEGLTEPGPLRPRVAARAVRPRGTADLPEPLPFDLSVAESGLLDGQWVRVPVVVGGASTGGGFTRVEVYSPTRAGTLLIPGEESAGPAGELRGAALVVRGVCVPEVSGGKVAGRPKVYLAALPKLPPGHPPPGTSPAVRAIADLPRAVSSNYPDGWRVRVAGVVTAAPFPGVLAVQDETGGVVVWARAPTAEVRVGTWVQADGLLRVDNGRRVGLVRATVSRVEPRPHPPAVPAQPAEFRTRVGTVVRTAGTVGAVREAGGVGRPGEWWAVALTDGASQFEAYAPRGPGGERLDGVEPGARVAVVGVYTGVTPDATPGLGPGVFLRDASAVTVTARPDPAPEPAPAGWWADGRFAVLAAGLLLAAAAVAGVWVWALRVRVRRAAREIQHQYEEKAKLEERLRRAAKLEAVGRLAGGIAHDFNNLLTVINGCAELAAEEAARRGGRLAELVGDIRRAGDRAAALTGQLLTFSRKRDVAVSAVDLNAVVADTVRLLDRVLGEDVRVSAALAPDLPPVRGEPGLLHRALVNLAVNARDAMPRGGTLTLATALVEGTGEITLGPGGPEVAGPDRYVRLTVADTGEGMSDEVKARLFEPFFTTKPVGKGTGLGLATVYGVVQTLRGKIRVDSAVGRGTTFEIDLRLHDDPATDSGVGPSQPTPPPARSLVPARLAGVTVLVVEDNEMVRDLLAGGLTGDGATVLAAPRPDHALRVLAAHPRVDVLVTDVVMPGMGGRELADRVRAVRPGVRVVFMSGYTADEVLRQGVLEEQVEFLQKPFTPDQLTARLLRLLGRG